MSQSGSFGQSPNVMTEHEKEEKLSKKCKRGEITQVEANIHEYEYR